MGHADFMRTFSNINCGLQSVLSYMNQRQSGTTPQVATTNLVGNIFNGAARNELAYDMQKCGISAGNVINSVAGYGNAASNAVGTIGLLSVAPWLYFNSPCSNNYSYNMNYNYFGPSGFWC